MNTASSSLKELHELHRELQEVHEKLRLGPKKVAARRQIVQQRTEALQKLRDQLLQIRKSGDEKSLQLKSNEAKILDLKAKLNAATSNREYDVFRGQIDADTMANSVLEDEILEVYEKADRLKQQIAKTEADVVEAEKEEKRAGEQIAAAEPALRDEADRLEGALVEAEKTLPQAVMERYRRLVQAHGAEALAAVAEKSCSACYTILAPNIVVELNLGKIVFCRACGRLLYRAEE